MKIRLLIALAGSTALACNSFAAAQTKTYKWIDKDGVAHYGDTVPPEYAERGHQELNAQGVAVRDFPRQMSAAEAAAAQQTAAEEKKRVQRDADLLANYTRVSDLENLRDERIALIDGQMELARGSIAATDQRIGGLRARLGGFKPYSTASSARKVPDQLAEEVVRALSERRSMAAQLEQRGKEKADQIANFNADIERYKTLTSRPRSR
jgi:predicted signal transduction protein with EAL and GGDEF domain